MLYFNVGQLVSEKVNGGNWGENTVQGLADFIALKQPELAGFNRRGLYRMKQFYETYSNPVFVSTLLTQLQWSAHLLILYKTKSVDEKLFYIQLTIKDKLSVRELERQLNSAFYERNMLGYNLAPKATAQISQGIFKDPYIFEFLDLPDTYSEKDVEKALIRNLQKFILETGNGLTYMGSQYRLQVGNKDYYTDLLFYQRDLQCLVFIVQYLFPHP